MNSVSFDIPTVTEADSTVHEPRSPAAPKSALIKRKSMLIRHHTSSVLAKVDDSAAGGHTAKPPAHPNESPATVQQPQSSRPVIAVSTPPMSPTANILPSPHAPPIQFSSTFTSSQSNATSLPDELLELIREFRVRIERVASHVGAGDANSAVQQLHHSGNDIIRYVTNFLIQKHEEELRYEQQKMMGWAAASKVSVDENGKLLDTQMKVASDVLGPFLLSTLYGILEALLLVLRCDRARLFLPDGATLKAVVTVGGGAIIPPEKADWNKIAGSVFRSGVAINVGDTSKAPPHLSSSCDDARQGYLLRSVLCMPLVSRYPEDAQGAQLEADSKPRVLGVVEFMNKSRAAAFGGVFSEEDEEAAHHYTLLMSNILFWGRNVNFCSNTSLEEGAKLQALLLAQRHFSSQLRTLSTAGSKTVTRTEAAKLVSQQKKKDDELAKRENLHMAIDHPFILAAERQHHINTTLVYRIACRRTCDALGFLRDDGDTTSHVAKEALAVIRSGGNVRELVQMLEQFDVSWKASRQKCVALERKVEHLEAQLRCEQGNTRALRQLCVSCGITPPPSTTTTFDALHSRNNPAAAAETLDNIGASLVEDGTVSQAISVAHRQIEERLRFASTRATNLGRRLQHTADASSQAARPTRANREASLNSLLRKLS